MNYHKGFIVPVLLILVAVFLFGGGAYMFQSKQASQLESVDQTISTTQPSADSVPVISRIEIIEGLPVGEVYAGERATIFGANLKTVVSVKIGDQTVGLTGSFGDADQGVFSTQQTFRVPELPAGVYSVSVTNSSGQTSNVYPVTVVVSTAR